jgi:predicted dehydrogenase
MLACRLQHLAAQYNCQVLSFEQSAMALDDPEVNAVIIATTSSSHFELITKSIAAGKHVFCEKPLALTYQDTVACVEAAAQANLALYCGKSHTCMHACMNCVNSLID